VVQPKEAEVEVHEILLDSARGSGRYRTLNMIFFLDVSPSEGENNRKQEAEEVM
jgi:hypothetical protein